MVKDIIEFLGFLYLGWCITIGTFMILFALLWYRSSLNDDYNYCIKLEVSAEKCHKLVYEKHE